MCVCMLLVLNLELQKNFIIFYKSNSSNQANRSEIAAEIVNVK